MSGWTLNRNYANMAGKKAENGARVGERSKRNHGKKSTQKRVKEIIKILSKEIPDATIALKFSNPFELLIATILSAQCTDVKVNQVTSRFI